ncbi:peptidoglycan DD-metalloendopeptidase family protein [Listeria sp. FSL L7-1485]|uniref:Peptidoglycan DD-metalloendopeptidase family protein n=1 Tax=Listeria immobilis TaxID=2713502 RepID=A0A7X0X6A1_9LIST|nr:peptidoglycan DD-metalloendopeptidase family protein [Listeria immobilis]MBC1482605.1 peptidoglycan DD-metalloendopeptidase family protein [Listeria immobilis]MBC1488275.1 peptidoglycan DD-metalloendopeptidase family protein [Listeria immobilis]MBC1507221.1 peptidoglycan DD-metalloendopeptidase family protein [Listeria immobilis]MBC1509867.1 peptidoglycan DD-metalloendopeptidase family protein [Listeria immobilis]MBC1535688.1 peptidoglycan DD-metalloendopeptidase family protein [Listeria im
MLKKYGVLATLGILIVSAPLSVEADTINDMQKRQNEIEQKKSELDKNIDTKSSEIANLETKEKDASKQLESLINSIDETNKKLRAQEDKVDSENQKLKQLKKDIEKLRKDIKERQEVLDKRARAIQKSGTATAYLDMIFEANDFKELVDRVTVVSTMVNADQNIMQDQKDDQDKLKVAESSSEKKLENLRVLAVDLAVSRNNMESQKAEKNDLVMALANKKDLTKNEKSLLANEQGSLSAEQKQLASNIAGEKAKQEAALKAAEQKRIQEAAAKANAEKASKSQTTVAQAPSPEVASAPSNVSSGGGQFIKPASGILTSGFSDRTNPVTGEHESHKGQDIAAGGAVTVSAAASGTVVFSGFGASGSGYGGYGYVVEIDHGNGFQTLYGHMRAGSLKVVAGQQVSQGQPIGIMGSTGQSTGQHLHFEIHQNGVPIDPAPYL